MNELHTPFQTASHVCFDITDEENPKFIDNFLSSTSAIECCERYQQEHPSARTAYMKVCNTFRTEIVYDIKKEWV